MEFLHLENEVCQDGTMIPSIENGISEELVTQHCSIFCVGFNDFCSTKLERCTFPVGRGNSPTGEERNL